MGGALFLVLGALALFGRGFLPPTHMETGYATECVPDTPALFDRVVMVVVDALRSDFMFDKDESNMPFVHSLVREGCALPFTARSDPPTVTLPRLKGLTTGAAPNFLDAVVNIAESDTASVLANQDSWLAQMLLAGRTAHMFGDDTWLKLFPDAFAEYEGTTSFYVSDYTEVDTNVTRHLPMELANQDRWDLLVLHYLGLDHIGHKGGPHSPLMAPKQREMDAIFQGIWESVDNRTLIIVAGDHGMNDVGNHGGASSGETSAALLLASPLFTFDGVECPISPDGAFEYYSKVQQVDLVTSLAVLLGLPIPRNSLGVMIPDILTLYTASQQKSILDANAKHLDCPVPEIAAMRRKQASLMRATSAHILPLMVSGVVLLAGIALWALYNVRYSYQAMILGILYFVVMMGSSTVEEEHYMWFWTASAMIVATENLKTSLIQLIVIRILRGWHGMGDKWASLPGSTGPWLVAHPRFMWTVVGLYALTWVFRQRRELRQTAWPAALAFCYFKLIAAQHAGDWAPYGAMFKNLSPLWPARIALLEAVVHWALSRDIRGFELILAIQSRPENLGQFALFDLVMRYAPPVASNPIAGLWWQYGSFFATGGSNSMATLDLSQAYNGVSGYSIPLVFLLGYITNWAGPLYWAFAVPTPTAIATWFYAVASFGIAVACLVLRQHLFIWTVFSPKFLYTVAWLVHCLVTTGIVKICRQKRH